MAVVSGDPDAAKGASGASWEQACQRAIAVMEAARKALKWGVNDEIEILPPVGRGKANSRGVYKTAAYGLSFGGGQEVNCELPYAGARFAD